MITVKKVDEYLKYKCDINNWVQDDGISKRILTKGDFNILNALIDEWEILWADRNNELGDTHDERFVPKFDNLQTYFHLYIEHFKQIIKPRKIENS